MEKRTESGAAWLTVPAEVSSLARVTEFVRRGALASGLPESEWGKLDLVLEEIVVNVARYAYPPGEPGTAEVGWSVEAPGRLVVQVCDRGIAYNPLEGEPPGFEGELEDRPVGGLGIFLVKNLADSVTYTRSGGCNILTFGFLGDPAGQLPAK